MKSLKYILLIVLIVIVLFVATKAVSIIFSSTDTSDYINTKEIETRGNPPYSWMIGKDHLPHMKVFFWVPIKSSILIPYSNKGVKTFVIGHGAINRWHVVNTGNVKDSLMLVYIFVPKTFVFTHGVNFYKLIHLYYN